MKNYKRNRRRLDTINKPKSHSEVVSFEIEIPSFEPIINSNNKVENGRHNSLYDFVEDSYLNSPTNMSIINSIRDYIVGEGLVDANGSDINSIISQEDVYKLSLDIKKFGAFTVQILWGLDETIKEIKYLNVKKVQLDIDDYGDIQGYYYSFDLKNQSKFPIEWFPKFDGTFKVNEEEEKKYYREILMVQNPSSNDFYSNCDYIPALHMAQLEKELATVAISFSNNQFQGSTLVNFNSGYVSNDAMREQYTRNIINELTGSTNSGRIIVSFNDDSASAPTIEQIALPEINDTYSLFSNEAQEKLILCHGVPPQLYAFKSASNLGASKDEITEATRQLFLRIVDPYRKRIINGLMNIFKFIDPEINLQFVDSEILKSIKNGAEQNEK